VLEARDRCGGRIHPLPDREFGYPAEGGAEFVHGSAPVTRALMREAQLSLSPLTGKRWRVRDGSLSPDESPMPDAARLHQALAELKADLPIAEFLERQFGDARYADLRRAVERMVEGYDAADPSRASTFALREEWMGRELGQPGRIVGGYGALVGFLMSACRQNGVAIHHGVAVKAVETDDGRIAALCRNGTTFDSDAAILTVPLPVLADIALPQAAREKAAAGADIGYGNVVKILLRFATSWWIDGGRRELADLSFLLSNAPVPTWWTQYPARHPVLTGWFAGPKTDAVSHLSANELVQMGLASLSEIFNISLDSLRSHLVASQAINWDNDPFARGAYSYATPGTRDAQSVLRQPDGSGVFFSGEALYDGPDMGTVEAALASGKRTAEMILSAE
jgi:monoamine oxidase